MVFIPPFDHLKVIEGQGTVGKEILDELTGVDYVFVPIGGGGLCAGVGEYFKTYSPKTKIVGVEPTGAPSMKEALKAGKPVKLEKDTAVCRWCVGTKGGRAHVLVLQRHTIGYAAGARRQGEHHHTAAL